MSTSDMPASEPERKPARYKQIVSLCASTPWAIRAEKLVAIKEMLTLRASGQRFTAEEIEARIGAGTAVKQTSSVGTVAVIPIYGVITPRADLFTEMSGGTSMQGFTESLAAAVADDSIGAILLDVDSPGGMTDLVPEAAAEIRAARGSKPIVAIANTDAASAAYWLASQADEFVVTPSGMVGSIGVFAAHDDVSAAMEQDGIKTTLISAGKYKTESNPFEPLSDEARAAIQERVDQFYGMFVKDVSKGRRVPIDSVRSGFGEGRIVTAQDALKLGMVDRIDTFESTVERLIVQAATASPVRQAAFAIAVPNAVGSASWATAIPPGTIITTTTTEAAESGLSFVQVAVALRASADRFTADTSSLCEKSRGRLSVTKRDALALVAESLGGSAAALNELLAESAADPGADDHARGVLALVRGKHPFLHATGVSG
jgi:signal peptide peptidase SppA